MPVASSRTTHCMTPPAPLSMPSSWRLRLALLCTRQVLGRALLAAVLVGSLLVFVHHGDAIFTGHITGRVVLKALLTALIPFCVTLLGALLNSNTAAGVEALRPGWRTVRRSLIIATVVGGDNYRCQSRRCPPGWSGDTPGVRQDAHNALCALLCLVLRRLCDVYRRIAATPRE